MKITITGIDHGVTPDELEQLARCEPTIEVEFAALLGSHNGSKPRYPPWSLIEAFAAFAKTAGLSSALHLCGKWAREAVSGNYNRELTVLARKFGRIQVNGQRDLEAIAAFGVRIRRPVIAQVASFEGTLGGLEYLHDASGGRGIRDFAGWPQAPQGILCGYAGGIGPENIDLAVRTADGLDGAWIDMETRVRRADDVLDKHKVEQVIRGAARAVAEMKYASASGEPAGD